MSWPRCVSDPARGLVAPRPGPGVCRVCFNLVLPTQDMCRACRGGHHCLESVTPISYSLSGGWLHTELVAYKRDADAFVPDAMFSLGRILDRFLSTHELCIAGATDRVGKRFDVVTSVPSGDPRRDALHPLRRILGELVEPTRDRYERLLTSGPASAKSRGFAPDRFAVTRELRQERVLLIDDMWTTGSSAQSAGAALLAAGAVSVSAVVIGRYLNRDYRDNRERVVGLSGEFDWSRCAICCSGAASQRGQASGRGS